MINLLSSATSTPEHAFDTTELIASLTHKLSPELVKTVGALGVERRYSTLANFPDYLRDEPMRATGSATEPTPTAARAPATAPLPRLRSDGEHARRSLALHQHGQHAGPGVLRASEDGRGGALV